MTIIRTPDQRVRVFISSTINELAEERRAARAAIAKLRLTPVFFEAGARPHPPRDLYSAYLDQSHIFLGIYWKSYGWVAPGAEISGLEDEYRLSGSKPRLIYLKRSSERQPRLDELLGELERSDTACYQFFDTPEELGHLIENDLSVLMSETFENALLDRRRVSEPLDEAPGRERRVDLPTLRGDLIGRKDELEAVAGLLARSRLVTLLGAGGTGKTTLSVHAAHQAEGRFPDGATFVPLAPVTDPGLVGATIAEALGLQDTGKQPVEATLAEFLSDREQLLVLDNFEQVAEASRLVSDLLMRAPGLTVLVTSRTALYLRGERLFHLGPLSLPPEGAPLPPGDSMLLEEELRRYPATRLFVERAQEVNLALALTPENAEAIVEICRRLDGLPLAIELAAARTRFFQPAALMSRIERTLDLVSRGHRDLPERQRTLRAAIEWSYDLLSEESQRAFRQLGVFRRSWTLEAAEVILSAGGDPVDVEEMTERLLDVSLIKPVLVSHSVEPRFNMLQTVHEVAAEMLATAPEGPDTTLAYARYFQELCLEADAHLWSSRAEPWLDRLEYEYQNLRAAFHIFVERGHLAEAWSMLPGMVRYWTIRGGYSEGMGWMKAAGVGDFERHGEGAWGGLDPSLMGRVMTWCALGNLMLLHLDEGFALLDRAEQLLREAGDRAGLAFTLTVSGCYGFLVDRASAVEAIAEADALAREVGDDLSLAIQLLWTHEHHLQAGRAELVARNLDRAEELAREIDDLYMLASIHMIRLSLAVAGDDPDFEAIAEDALTVSRMMPESGYAGLRATVMSIRAFALTMSGAFDQARIALDRTFRLARESGEGEALLSGGVTAALHGAKGGDSETALRVLGAVDALSERSGYPLTGALAVQRALTLDALAIDDDSVARDPQYIEGRGRGIVEAVAM